MNILLISPLPPPVGGIATWTEEYCERIAAMGHHVRVVNTAVTGKRAAQNRRFLLDELRRTHKVFSNMRSAIREEKFDIVHVNTACSKFGLLRDVCCLLMAGKTKTILHCHCNVEDQIGTGKLGRKLLAFAVKRADHVLVLNQRSHAFIRSNGCDNVQIVPNFIDKKLLAEKHAVAEHGEIMLYVGHILRTKGFFEILEAARALPQIQFWMVGPTCMELDDVEIPENVTMYGAKPRSEVMEMMKQADVFLFPSYTEGFSKAVLEAMACGLPVIASDVGANRDMLEDRGGIIIPPQDSNAIIHAISQIQDAQLRQCMSEWNIQKVADCYTTDAVLQKITTI